MSTTFRPLHQYDWSEQLQIFDQLSDVKTRLIDGYEPRVIAEIFQRQQLLTMGLSSQRAVRGNPIRDKPEIIQKAKSVAEVVDDVKLQLHAADIKNVLAPVDTIGMQMATFNRSRLVLPTKQLPRSMLVVPSRLLKRRQASLA